MSKRWHIFFGGKVQGVGFRFTSVETAKRFAVSGWVRNLTGGQVEMMVEGQSAELRKFVDEVTESTYGNVKDVLIERSEGTGEFSGFKIRPTAGGLGK